MTIQSLLKEENKEISIRKICKVLDVPRSTFYYKTTVSSEPIRDMEVEAEIRKIIDEEPAVGLRMITAMVRKRLNRNINRKKIHRIIKLNNWQVNRKRKGQRPRVKGWSSRANRPNERWAIDMTHIYTGTGLCHLTAVIDCCDRSIVGWRLSGSSKADIAAAALEDALLFNGISKEDELILRSDNGLIFGAKNFTDVVKRFKVQQEYITPYTPEQNGMIERFFRTLKENCVWLHRFKDQDDAFQKVAQWIHKYNMDRPHSALNYESPMDYRMKLVA